MRVCQACCDRVSLTGGRARDGIQTDHGMRHLSYYMRHLCHMRLTSGRARGIDTRVVTKDSGSRSRGVETALETWRLGGGDSIYLLMAGLRQ